MSEDSNTNGADGIGRRIDEKDIEQGVREVIDKMAIGYRFNPTEEELVRCYLLPEARGDEIYMNPIRSIDLYAYTPEEISRKYPLHHTELVWCFFTNLKKKHPKARPCRSISDGSGVWKAIGRGNDVPVEIDGCKLTATKRRFDYHHGNDQRSAKMTEWKMYEFSLSFEFLASSSTNNRSTMQVLDDIVLCKIYKNSRTSKQGSDDGNKNRPQKDAVQESPPRIPKKIRIDGGARTPSAEVSRHPRPSPPEHQPSFSNNGNAASTNSFTVAGPRHSPPQPLSLPPSPPPQGGPTSSFFNPLEVSADQTPGVWEPVSTQGECSQSFYPPTADQPNGGTSFHLQEDLSEELFSILFS